MTNAYVSLDTLKSSGVLNITGARDDARLRSLAESVSRMIDRYCNRRFFALSATRKFDGDGSARLLLPDLISVNRSGLKTDDNMDGSFETTWLMDDYILLPSNADPANSGNPESRPYTAVEAARRPGGKTRFPAGRETVRISGVWGWWRHLKRAPETAGAIPDATTTTLTLSARVGVEAGHTILIGAEQIYVESCSGDSLTARRGVNGTTASSHADGAPIDIYEYPGPIVEAVIIQAARLWKRKDGAFGGAGGFHDERRAESSSGLDPDAALLLAQYRKAAVGVGA